MGENSCTRSASGWQQGCFIASGSQACWLTTSWRASTGAGWRWTELWARRLWEGKETGPNPTDRAKSGTKRSLLTDGRGIPLGLVVAGANTNDFKLVQQTFDSVPVPWPKPAEGRRQHLCVDACYDYAQVHRWADKFGFTLHVRRIRQEKTKSARNKPRRWVVERSHSFINRFRRLLVRWEKREDTYVAMLHFAMGFITRRLRYCRPFLLAIAASAQAAILNNSR